MKITKKMFKGFEGLEKLEKIQKEGYCNSWACSKCPLKNSNINGNINGNKIECSDIIDLSLYREKDPEAISRMDKLINIFTKENINAILAKLAPSRNLKYNDYVVYDNKTFKIKGVIENSESSSLILLNGYSKLSQIDKQCLTNKKSIENGYNIFVDPSEIFALNDTVIEKKSNIEYRIVAIATPDHPILLNGYLEGYLNINDCEDIFSSIPEAHEKDYNKWVVSYNIKHK